MSVLSSPHFHDEAKAFEYLESIVWADGVVPKAMRRLDPIKLEEAFLLFLVVIPMGYYVVRTVLALIAAV